MAMTLYGPASEALGEDWKASLNLMGYCVYTHLLTEPTTSTSSFLPSLRKHWQGAHRVPGTVLGAGSSKVNEPRGRFFGHR